MFVAVVAAVAVAVAVDVAGEAGLLWWLLWRWYLWWCWGYHEGHCQDQHQCQFLPLLSCEAHHTEPWWPTSRPCYVHRIFLYVARVADGDDERNSEGRGEMGVQESSAAGAAEICLKG